LIYALVFVKMADGSKAILNRYHGDILQSLTIRREAFMTRDNWRISGLEPHAQVEISYKRPENW
jgi:hypothetical protein